MYGYYRKIFLIHQHQSAFSLVELSIVLVILGLLTGGILTGQSLIRAAELRAVTTEAEQFATAANTFKTKYFMLPGDMNNAEAFWQRSTACGGASATGVCNGNGDGFIDVTSWGAGGQPYEIYMFWRELALAGLINGTYTGIAGSGGSWHSIPTTNVPPSKVSNGAWGVFHHYDPTHPILHSANETPWRNDLLFGARTNDAYPENPALTPEEAWNIDTKMDDGRPARGKIFAGHWGNNSDDCTTGTASNDANATYRLSDSAVRCVLLFRKPF